MPMGAAAAHSIGLLRNHNSGLVIRQDHTNGKLGQLGFRYAYLADSGQCPFTGRAGLNLILGDHSSGKADVKSHISIDPERRANIWPVPMQGGAARLLLALRIKRLL
jgi:hypothetical protein